MFDIGFGELLLVFIIGLVVIGPERLPATIRAIAGWMKTLRSLAASVQSELSQELKLQALQDSLKKAEQAGLQHLAPELERSINELKEVAQVGLIYHANNHSDAGKSCNEEVRSLSNVPSALQTVSMQSEMVTKPHKPFVSKDEIPARRATKNKKVALNRRPVFQKACISDKSNDDC